MPSLIAAAALLVFLSFGIEIFYSAYALSLFKEAYPEEFRACGSPSIIFIGNGILFSYLIRNKHRDLANPVIVRILERYKWIQIFAYVSMFIFALTLFA